MVSRRTGPRTDEKRLIYSREVALNVLANGASSNFDGNQTPNLGIEFDIDSAVSAKPPGALGKNAEPVIKWFRTVVELDATPKYNWAEMSPSACTN